MVCLFVLVPDPDRLSPLLLLLECHPVAHVCNFDCKRNLSSQSYILEQFVIIIIVIILFSSEDIACLLAAGLNSLNCLCVTFVEECQTYLC